MFLYGVEWPEGWEAGDHNMVRVLGEFVFRAVGSPPSPAWHFGSCGYRVRRPFTREVLEGHASKGDWIAEYLTRNATHHVGKSTDPHVACGLCLLYDTTEADAEAFW